MNPPNHPERIVALFLAAPPALRRAMLSKACRRLIWNATPSLTMFWFSLSSAILASASNSPLGSPQRAYLGLAWSLPPPHAALANPAGALTASMALTLVALCASLACLSALARAFLVHPRRAPARALARLLPLASLDCEEFALWESMAFPPPPKPPRASGPLRL